MAQRLGGGGENPPFDRKQHLHSHTVFFLGDEEVSCALQRIGNAEETITRVCWAGRRIEDEFQVVFGRGMRGQRVEEDEGKYFLGFVASPANLQGPW